MIRGPGSTDRQFAVLQLLGGAAIPVLILFHRFGVNQVSDVDQHAVRVDSLAADLFFQWIEQLMDLHGERSRLGSPFAVLRSLFPQLDEVIASDRVRQNHVGHGFAEGTIPDPQLQVHLSFATQAGNALTKSRRLVRTAWRSASSVSKIVPKRNGNTVPLRKHALTTRACSRTFFSPNCASSRAYSLTTMLNSPLG